MANLFEATNAPVGEPAEIVIGDFVQWKRTDIGADYPPASHTAKYVARLRGGTSTELAITSSASGSDYLFSAASSATANYISGRYHWQLEMLQNSDNSRLILERGEWEIVVDLDTAGTDPRTHAEIMVDKIESLLSGRADADVSNYSIQGRSLVKLTIDDLLQWRDYYRREAAMQKRKRDIKNGKRTKSTVMMRFV